jgi:hypothetical protein
VVNPATVLTVLALESDTSSFINHHADGVAYLLYVDDIVLTASSPQLLQRIISSSAGVCHEGSGQASPLLGRDS